MSSGLYIWSQTAASNATADSTINWAEGQAPSSINDSARAMMAGIAKFRDDIAGGIATGGTSTAYTVSSYQVFDTLAHMHNQNIAFVPNATNTNAVGADVTLNVDSLGAKPIRMQPSVALPNGSLVLGTPYIVTYNNTDGAFYLQGWTNPYNIPLAAGMDYWGTSTPNSSFAFPTGQAISRTTYATLFSLFSTTFGSGDGSTTFNLPDKTGRVSAMKEATGTRLTTAGSGIDGGTMGSAGGAQNVTIAQSGLPNIAPTFTGSSGAVSVTSNLANIIAGTLVGGVVSGAGALTATSGGSQNTPTASGSFTPVGTVSSINGNTTQTTTNKMPPTIVCNYILRII